MNSERTGAEAAEKQRGRLGLGHAPLADMSALVDEMTPFDLVVMDMPDGLDAMIATDANRSAGFIAVATTRSPFRQRFSIAHELGHASLGTISAQLGCTVNGSAHRPPEEVAADAFARHFLAPLPAVRQHLDDAPGPLVALSDVVRIYGVSPTVAAIQLRDAGMDESVVELAKSQTAPKLATRFGWRDEYDARSADSQKPKAPRRLLDDAVTAYSEGRVGLGLVARVANQSLEDERLILEEADVRPTLPEPEWFSFDVDS